MPRFLVLSGLPGSGKTTFRDNFLKDNPDTVVLSVDDVLEGTAERLGVPFLDLWKPEHEDWQHAARNVLRYRLQEALKKDQDVIWDQANLTFDERRQRVDMAPDHYEKIAIAFETDADVLVTRNDARKATGRNLPQPFLDALAQDYVRPHFDEGFDKIVVITNNTTSTVL